MSARWAIATSDSGWSGRPMLLLLPSELSEDRRDMEPDEAARTSRGTLGTTLAREPDWISERILFCTLERENISIIILRF